MEYKITFWHQLRQLIGVVIGIPVALFLIYAFYQLVGDFSSVTTVIIIYFSVTFGITIFVHCEYYLLNRGAKLFIDGDKKTISFPDVDSMPFEDLEKITLLVTQLNYGEGNIWVLPSDPYHYAIIRCKGNKKFVFTSLMALDIAKAIKDIQNVPIEKKLRPIPSPLLARAFGSE